MKYKGESEPQDCNPNTIFHPKAMQVNFCWHWPCYGRDWGLWGDLVCLCVLAWAWLSLLAQLLCLPLVPYTTQSAHLPLISSSTCSTCTPAFQTLIARLLFHHSGKPYGSCSICFVRAFPILIVVFTLQDYHRHSGLPPSCLQSSPCSAKSK